MAADEAARGEIEVQSFPLVSVLKRHALAALADHPRRRRARRVAADRLQRAEHLRQRAAPEDEEPISQRRRGSGTVALALALAIGLFFLLPVGLTSLVKDALPNSLVFVIVEKLMRVTIFLLYLWAVSRMKDLQRVFEYHGAEHKTISCYEAGLPLTPENAQRFSRLHPRCGTSFMLIVMVVAVVVFAPLGTPAWYWLFASRIVGIPLVAGLAFEVIKWMGRNRTKRWAQLADAARAEASAADDARARPRPARRRDRRARGRARRRDAGRRERRGPRRHGGRGLVAR